MTPRSSTPPGHRAGRGRARLLGAGIGLAALGLGLAGPLLADHPVAAATTTAPQTPPTTEPPTSSTSLPGTPNIGRRVADGTDGKVAGMAIPNVSQQQSPDEVTRLKSDGLNTIALFVWWVMQKQNSNSIQPDYQDGLTETDANLELQMAASVQDGMHVILVPIFYCLSCQGGWRGTIAPSDPSLWWQSYQSFINHYADIAQQHGAGTLFVGSEMTSMEQYTSQWEQVISVTRTHFSGQIGYEENWDVLGQAKFLSDVDVVGISAYFPLDDAASPALSDLLADWTDSHASATAGQNWVSQVTKLAQSTGKPILFGECGYMSGDHAARQPFLNYLDTTNWQLQSDLYQAVLETFSDKSWWAGVVWWEWYLTSDTTSDNDRSPRGKTAEDMLRHWYALGERPPDPGTPLVYSLPQYSPDDAEVPRPSPTAAGPSGGGDPKPSPGGSATGAGSGPTGGGTGGGAKAQSVGGAASVNGYHSGAGGSGPTAAGALATGKSVLSGRGRTTAILASVALLVVILALAVLGLMRRPRATSHPPP
ncbi:MAG: glycoside hydrolase family 113 [Acidimicrobiales bacterium]